MIRNLTPGRWAGTLALLLAILVITLGVCAAIGSERYDFGAEWRAAVDGGWSEISAGLRQVRLPRVLLAAVAGGALALAGAVYQAILRNPLAEPYLLGIAGGASAGAILLPLLGLGAGALAWVAEPALAFGGALVALGLLLGLGRMQGGLHTFHLILTGVILSVFFSAMILFVISRSQALEVQEIWFRVVGSLWGGTWTEAAVLAGCLGLGGATLFPMARALNLLALGEDEAESLGVSVQRTRRWGLVLASLVTGATVSVCGQIGFVGLIVPHALRLILGADHRLLLPASVLGGAAFLVVADTAARSLWAPEAVPVGVITALLGGPFFLALLVRRRATRPEVAPA